MAVKVSSKYQVVIPEEARDILDIKPGTEVEVIVKGKIAYLVPVPSLKDLQERFAGKLDSKNLRDKSDKP